MIYMAFALSFPRKYRFIINIKAVRCVKEVISKEKTSCVNGSKPIFQISHFELRVRAFVIISERESITIVDERRERFSASK